MPIKFIFLSLLNLQIYCTLFSFLGSKVTIYVLGPEGYETMDVTEEVEKIDEEKQRKKYTDIDYLADRANMKKDDPRFDPDFWRMYFKNIDGKRGMTPARKLERVMNWDEET
jgi:hypothetical protein